jgi:DinB superfamily
MGELKLELAARSSELALMKHTLNETMALLRRTPDVLNALLRGLPETWTTGNEGDGTWTPSDVVAHLIHAEREDWIPRARTILEHGENQAFAPFDREGNFQESRRRSLEELLDEFARARSESLQQLGAMNLRAPDMERKGKHPALGSVTLSELLATWAAHDLTHLHQISRVMAVQYREAVGPWSKFLGVMHCAGHGA